MTGFYIIKTDPLLKKKDPKQPGTVQSKIFPLYQFLVPRFILTIYATEAKTVAFSKISFITL